MNIKKLSTVMCNSSPIIGLSGIGKLDLWESCIEVN